MKNAVLFDERGVTLVHGDCFDVAPGHVDAVITDTPYSEKTHRGHDEGVAGIGRGYQRKSNGGRPDSGERRTIGYAPWSPVDVARFVTIWAPVCRGWFVAMCDDVLDAEWQAALECAGRYAFAPIPYVAKGSRVRRSGDGPSAWTTWIVPARPRTAEFMRWGTLDGAYILPPGCRERMRVVGGKPVWLLERLLEDYTRPGDLIADPCAGGATLGIAAMRLGRRALLVEKDRRTALRAAEHLRSESRRLRRARLA